MNKKTIISFLIVILLILVVVWFYKNKYPQPEPPNPNAVVVWRDHAVVGPHLVDSKGFTLYTYNQDPELKSVCLNKCAKQWPPFEFNNKDIDGIDDDLTHKLNIVKRDDGMYQFAYENQPLYYFMGDTHAGEVFGHGINDQWSIVKLDQ